QAVGRIQPHPDYIALPDLDVRVDPRQQPLFIDADFRFVDFAHELQRFHRSLQYIHAILRGLVRDADEFGTYAQGGRTALQQPVPRLAQYRAHGGFDTRMTVLMTADRCLDLICPAYEVSHIAMLGIEVYFLRCAG